MDSFYPINTDENGTVTSASIFNPHEYIGGTLVAIAGNDFATIACDTRLTNDFNIRKMRSQSKLFDVSPQTVLGSVGCWCDTLALLSLVRSYSLKYELDNLMPVCPDSLASMLTRTKFTRQYFVSSVVAGIDSNGLGAVYFNDPSGNYLRLPYHISGTGGRIILPTLDWFEGNEEDQMNAITTSLTVDKAVEISMEAFRTARDRDIFIGNCMFINIITREGVQFKQLPLP
ncbi:uncharacterized protein Dwil_GK20619 [Drosophila willistoni]|uniref:Uncharacterized protein n=1 Tax=Drosophila willistoni TaxID=7260 RepID=B4MI81_DROWI|nr:proteasome subunit beta type-1-like [Drosophila willistoni]EDW71820.1 uncharacterized protein Dwil_GK20619 [Drosophila willistoni]